MRLPLSGREGDWRDIAIVGMSCRFPGARDVTELWQLLLEARTQFRPVPAGRWRHATFHDPAMRRAPHRTYTDQVAFLDDVESFASRHYHLPPRRARAMDPQHRLLIDLAREALQDAGWERHQRHRERMGVFVGLSAADYREISSARLTATLLADGSLRGDEPDEALLAAIEDAAERALTPVQAFSLTGCLLNMAPCTVSNVFDLGGPSFAVDAACSSALVAMNEAVMHLRAGTCEAALVGGVFLNLTPSAMVGFSRVGALSVEGRCRPFDSRADGFVLGEGGALLLVRPLAAAIADGDRVYAVIKGVGASNDGGGAGAMAPQATGQLAALRAAYEDARVSPATVGLVEAHGTATRVGDRSEVEALRLLREDQPRPVPCFLSASKALIGHALPASGAAGLVKAALALHHATIPPQPQTDPDPDLPLEAAGLEITTVPRPWDAPAAHPRRSGVNSFGFGGTNVHVVLEEAPARTPDAEERPWLLLLSGGSIDLLASHAEAVRRTVAADRRMVPSAVAFTLATRRPLEARLALVAGSRGELLARLDEAVRALRAGAVHRLGAGMHAAPRPRPPEDRRLAFLYPGQGAQRPGMLADVCRRFPPFTVVADRLDGVASEVTGRSLRDLLGAPPAGEDAALVAAGVRQPLLGMLQMSMAGLLMSCGVTPDLALGHAEGELALFGAAVRAAEDAGARVMVQVTAGSSLLSMARHALSDAAAVELVPASGEEPDDGRTLLDGLGRLAVLGVPVDLTPLFAPAQRSLVTLPPSPLATERYTVRRLAGAVPGAATAARPDERTGDHVTLTGRTSAPSPAAAVLPSPAEQTVRSAVLDTVGGISGHRADELREDHALIADLGFDSIMLVELAAALRGLRPDLEIGLADLARIATIGDVVAALSRVEPSGARNERGGGTATLVRETATGAVAAVTAPGSRLRFDATVPRHLVHRESVAEVFITDWLATGDSMFDIAAQLPRSHCTSDGGPMYDLTLLVEVARQAGVVVAHGHLGVGEDTAFVFRSLRLRVLDLESTRIGPRPARVLGSMRVEVERGGGGRLQGLRSEGLLTIDGRRALEVAGTQLFLTRDGYRTFRAHGRARRLELPRPIGASRARARPRVVGRRDPRNVVITEPTALGGGRVGAWLVVDVGHPYLFDHPLDHVPGNLQLEACRQAAVAAVARDHGLVADGLVAVGISVDFADFAELDVPTRVTAEVAQPRLDRERERAVVPVAVALTQGDATVATATVEVSA